VRASVLAGVGEKSGVLARMHVAGPKLMLRRHAPMLALLIASFAAADRAQAQAACTPATTPLPNTTVDCIGTINNLNGNGFGTAADSGNQITVESGASVTGSTNGVQAPGPSKVINLGTITGNEGIRGSDSTIVDNSSNISGIAVGVDGVSHLINRTTGNITSSGNSSEAVQVGGGGGGTIDNDGHITATGASSSGIRTTVGALIVNNTSTGFITATGAGSFGITNQGINGTIVLTNSHTISGGAFGVDAFDRTGGVATGDVTVTNTAGTISATDADGVAIRAGLTATVSNSSTTQATGTIQATAPPALPSRPTPSTSPPIPERYKQPARAASPSTASALPA
jgi:hypothetical protein